MEIQLHVACVTWNVALIKKKNSAVQTAKLKELQVFSVSGLTRRIKFENVDTKTKSYFTILLVLSAKYYKIMI